MSDTYSKMALLVMDMQEEIVTRFAQTGDILTPMRTAIAAARAASIPVILCDRGLSSRPSRN